MTLPKMLQSPDRDVLLVSALISTVVVPLHGMGVMAYLITGLVFAVLPRLSLRQPSGEPPLTGEVSTRYRVVQQ